MKTKLTSLLLVLSGSLAIAQQDPQFSQNMFNKLATNPGYAGTSQAICANLIGRQQWMGFITDNAGNHSSNGIPKTYLFSVDATVDKLHGGLGLTVFSDQLGFDKTFSAKLAYSFHMPIGAGTLGIGPEIGVMQKSLGGLWKAPDGTDGTSDAVIPQNESSMTYDVGFGLYYTLPNKLYFGLSSTHLPESTFKGATSYEFVLKRHYYVTAGYSFQMGNMLELKPSIFAKSEASSTQLDVNLIAEYNKTFWGGVSYRLTDAIVAMVGFQKQVGKSGTFKIGYAYDVTTSSIKGYTTTGTHEIMLGYCFNKPKKVKTQSHQNVRFF